MIDLDLPTEPSEESEPPAKKPKKLPKILDGKFYIILSETDGDIQAKCAICGEVRKGQAGKGTGNFHNHYKTKHNSKLKELKAYSKNDDYTETAKSCQPTLNDVLNVMTPQKVCTCTLYIKAY